MADSSDPRSSAGWLMPARWSWLEYPVDWTVMASTHTKPGTARVFSTREESIIRARVIIAHEVQEALDYQYGHIEAGMAPRNTQFPYIEFPYTALGGVAYIIDHLERIGNRIASHVLWARSQRWTWAAIGRALGISPDAAHKKFAKWRYQADERGDPTTQETLAVLRSVVKPREELSDLSLFASIEDGLEIILTDVVIQSRCEGFSWKDIGSVLRVGQTAAQKRFGRGLSPVRKQELDSECRWVQANVEEDYLQVLENLRETRTAMLRSLTRC